MSRPNADRIPTDFTRIPSGQVLTGPTLDALLEAAILQACHRGVQRPAPPKYLAFARHFLDLNYEVHIDFAASTTSVYIFVVDPLSRLCYKVRFAGHPPDPERLAEVSADFYVHPTTPRTTLRDAITATEIFFDRYKEPRHD